MTKYVAKRSVHKNCYHTDPECRLLNQSPKEATENEIRYHELELCPECDKNE